MNGVYYESDFEEAFIDLLKKEGWQYTPGEFIDNRKETEALIENDLKEYLEQRYGSDGLSETENSIIRAKIRNVSGGDYYECLRNACQLYIEGFNFVRNDSSLPSIAIRYIDFEKPENNIFRVVNQFSMQEGEQTRRPDIMLFVNGIPVCIIELKNPTKLNATVFDAHEQITIRYTRDIPSLTKYCAIACISDGVDTLMGTTITPLEYFYAWKKINNNDRAGSKGVGTLQTLISGALSPNRIIEILRDYIYFPDVASNKEYQIICRYPQFFATRKLRENIIKVLQSNGGNGKGGTYFGATGCGKTFTMLFLARQLALRCRTELGSPTIILIVDREDLETQAAQLFCFSKHFLCDEEVRVFNSRNELCQELSSRNGGGFYVTTIQKFSESTGLLSERTNIICMSDEAHRSQNNLGDKLVINTDASKGEIGAFITKGFAYYLRSALPKATYVGFTGTPIDDTVKVFGEIVDKYTMSESQADGITVDIKYDARLARVFMDDEKAKEVEAYYKQCEEEGSSEEQIKKSKAAMTSMTAILGDEGRMRRVAKDIVEDYEARLENEPELLQKAMVTCMDRNIAYRLLQYILELRPEWGEEKRMPNKGQFSEDEYKKLTPVPYINLVATQGCNDPKEMFDYLGNDEHRKMLDKEFKSEKSNFHIAIVVDMWITGFDCPMLRFLYNDKPLQKHSLIQTISRVNRKYKTKEYGLVIDYIGIRENMKKALKQYTENPDEPNEIIGGPDELSDVDIAHQALCTELQILKDMCSSIDFNKFFNGTALERMMFLQDIAEYILANSFEPSEVEVKLAKEENRKPKASLKNRFRSHVLCVRTAYNICAPAGDVLSENEMMWSNCFMGISQFITKLTGGPIDVKTMNKAVEKMLQEAILCLGVESLYDEKLHNEDIFSNEFLRELDDKHLPSTKFEILAKMLKRKIDEYKKVNKVKGEAFDIMLQKVIDDYNTRDKLTFVNKVAETTIDKINEEVDKKVKSLTERLLDIFKGLNKDKEEFKALGITFEEKAFYDILIDIRDRNKFEYPEEKCIELAKKIKELVDGTAIYANFLNNPKLRSTMSSNIAHLLYRASYPPEWDEEVFNRIMGQVENYKKYNE